jgi:RNA polymerase sigma-70 factor (ECF subfamily)
MSSEPAGTDALDAEDTLRLLTEARGGSASALDRLFERYIPGLRAWASGRLPAWARDLADTHDLVQEAAFRVFRKLNDFEYRGEGALKAYLRQALMNGIRNEIRRVRGRPTAGTLDPEMEGQGALPIDLAIEAQALERYERALRRLMPAEREVIVARVELGLSYQEIATRLAKPSADAARMAVARAIRRLSQEMS